MPNSLYRLWMRRLQDFIAAPPEQARRPRPARNRAG